LVACFSVRKRALFSDKEEGERTIRPQGLSPGGNKTSGEHELPCGKTK
jgi:hypothetical protein